MDYWPSDTPSAANQPVVESVEYKSVRDALEKALKSLGGVTYLRDLAEEHPKAFMALLGKVMPIEVNERKDITIRVEHALPYPGYRPHNQVKDGVVTEYSVQDITSPKAILARVLSWEHSERQSFIDALLESTRRTITLVPTEDDSDKGNDLTDGAV